MTRRRRRVASRGRAFRRQREEVPFPRHALEGLATAVLEAKAGAGDQVLDRARHKDFTGPGGGGHPSTDVDGEPGDLVALELDLASMQTGAYLEPDRARPVAHGPGTANGPGRPVEG